MRRIELRPGEESEGEASKNSVPARREVHEIGGTARGGTRATLSPRSAGIGASGISATGCPCILQHDASVFMLLKGQSGGMFWQQPARAPVEATRQQESAGASVQSKATSVRSPAFLPRFTMN